MLSAAKIKLIHSLSHKKFRDENGLFLAEGIKIVDELNSCFECEFLAATEKWFSDGHSCRAGQTAVVTEEELRKVSLLQAPQEVLALYRIPDRKGDISIASKELCLALDGIQDPGNLGTIVRLADWFGIEHIFCSKGTADIYNPKAVQATMGAVARVSLHYLNLEAAVSSLPSGVPVYGTFMDGADIYKEQLSRNGVIVMGNEGSGISSGLERIVSKRIGIPNYPAGRETSESLNVATATAIICSEFRRRM